MGSTNGWLVDVFIKATQLDGTCEGSSDMARNACTDGGDC